MKIYSVTERIDVDCSFDYKPIMFFNDRSLAEKQCEILLDAEPWRRGDGYISDEYTVDEFEILESVYVPEKKRRRPRNAQPAQQPEQPEQLAPPKENEIRVTIQNNISREAYNVQKTETLTQIIERAGFSDYIRENNVYVNVLGVCVPHELFDKPISELTDNASSVWISITKPGKIA